MFKYIEDYNFSDEFDVFVKEIDIRYIEFTKSEKDMVDCRFYSEYIYEINLDDRVLDDKYYRCHFKGSFSKGFIFADREVVCLQYGILMKYPNGLLWFKFIL